MSCIAVIDVGSARMKRIVVSKDDPTLFFTNSVEFPLIKGLKEGDEIPSDGLVKLSDALLRLTSVDPVVLKGDCIAIATHAARKASNVSQLLEVLGQYAAKTEIISQEREGAIFNSGVRTSLKEISGSESLVCDVGGGSVQVGKASGTVIGAEIGTYTLESRFQSGSLLLTEERERMHEFLTSKFSALGVGSASRIVWGSSCVATFVRGFLSHLKLSGTELSPLFEQIHFDDLVQMRDYLMDKPYDSLAAIYPENPGYMYGADKAIEVVYALAKVSGSSSIVCTDHSVATALASELASSSEQSSIS